MPNLDDNELNRLQRFRIFVSKVQELSPSTYVSLVPAQTFASLHAMEHALAQDWPVDALVDSETILSVMEKFADSAVEYAARAEHERDEARQQAAISRAEAARLKSVQDILGEILQQEPETEALPEAARRVVADMHYWQRQAEDWEEMVHGTETHEHPESDARCLVAELDVAQKGE